MTLQPSDTQQAAQALVPVFHRDPSGEKKSQYLSYLYTGFTVRESLELCGLREWNPRRWRESDSVFAQLEDEVRGPRRQEIRREVLQNLFLRNLRRVWDKDAQVIEKSLTAPDDMTKLDAEYLFRLRQHYTPQQLQILEGVLKPGTFDGQDISRLIMEAFSSTPDGAVSHRRLEVQHGS